MLLFDMKNYIILLILLVTALHFKAKAQLSDGVYLNKTGGVNNLILIKDQYFSFINYDDGNKEFGYTWGGPLRQQANTISLLIEYNSKDSTRIGKTANLHYKDENSAVYISMNGSERPYIKQKALSQNLDALWRITGRQEGNTMRDIPRADRKTIKILVDGYFQWIAINPAQKGFYGTGGGYYQFVDNRYMEKILFFSRDNNRVGQQLHFDGKLENNTWHHRGKSSKGDDIYEIWSKEIAK